MAKNKGNSFVASYVIGFILSVFLAGLAVSLVRAHQFSAPDLYAIVAALGVVQFLVQALCFLRLNASSAHDKWNLISFIFTLFIIALVVTGSLWIMYNLNYNMVSH